MIKFTNLTLGYERHPAVHHLYFEIKPQELLAIIGPNGAGKSTLLKGITGLLSPLGGEIDLNGLNREEIAYLPQQAEIDRTFPITVFDMVAMGLWRKIGAFLGLGKEDKDKVNLALARVGLTGLEKRGIGTLSGGQMQRALFARLLLQDATLILLDEPFSAIDTASVRDLMELVQHWQQEGRTIIAVLHDLGLVASHFPQTLLLAREKVASGPTAQVLTPENLAKAQDLSHAFDERADFCNQ